MTHIVVVDRSGQEVISGKAETVPREGENLRAGSPSKTFVVQHVSYSMGISMGELTMTAMVVVAPALEVRVYRDPRPGYTKAQDYHKRLKDAKQWEIAAAMVALALEDEKEGRVVRSHGDHLILAEVHKFFSVPEDVRVKAMVDADDGEAGYERCRHMLKAAFAVET